MADPSCDGGESAMAVGGSHGPHTNSRAAAEPNSVLDERLIEQERSTASRAAIIARTLVDERHRKIAFAAAYHALQPSVGSDVAPVIRSIVRCRERPDLAPMNLRRIACAVHIACEVASKGRPNIASLYAAGLAAEVRDWTAIAARL
jgi:hypothetical protein